MITWGPIIYPFAKKLWEKRKQSKVNSDLKFARQKALGLDRNRLKKHICLMLTIKKIQCSLENTATLDFSLCMNIVINTYNFCY